MPIQGDQYLRQSVNARLMIWVTENQFSVAAGSAGQIVFCSTPVTRSRRDSGLPCAKARAIILLQQEFCERNLRFDLVWVDVQQRLQHDPCLAHDLPLQGIWPDEV